MHHYEYTPQYLSLILCLLPCPLSVLPVLGEVADPRRADVQHVGPLRQRLGVVLRQSFHGGIV